MAATDNGEFFALYLQADRLLQSVHYYQFLIYLYM